MENKNEKALATADFLVYGIREWDGEAIDTTVHLALYRSDSFNYGNGTVTTMQFAGNDHMEAFDTRYEAVNVQNFVEFAKKLVENHIAEGLKVEPIES